MSGPRIAPYMSFAAGAFFTWVGVVKGQSPLWGCLMLFAAATAFFYGSILFIAGVRERYRLVRLYGSGSFRATLRGVLGFDRRRETQDVIVLFQTIALVLQQAPRSPELGGIASVVTVDDLLRDGRRHLTNFVGEAMMRAFDLHVPKAGRAPTKRPDGLTVRDWQRLEVFKLRLQWLQERCAPTLEDSTRAL